MEKIEKYLKVIMVLLLVRICQNFYAMSKREDSCDCDDCPYSEDF